MDEVGGVSAAVELRRAFPGVVLSIHIDAQVDRGAECVRAAAPCL
jgi:hypothetical protein